jgi:hypothetical protein
VASRSDVRDLPQLGRGTARRLLAREADPDGVTQVALRDARDARRDGGREQRRLPFVRRLAQDGVEVLGETHVEHLIGLVENDEARVVQAQRAALQVIDRAPRRRDHDIHAALKAAKLMTDRLAAVHGQDLDLEAAPIPMHRLPDLHRKLAGRHEDQALGPSGPGTL